MTAIENIPTLLFNEILETMIRDGWKKVSEYDGFDAWMDFGHVVLKKGTEKLEFEWDNWMEGIIRGPSAVLEELSRTYQL